MPTSNLGLVGAFGAGAASDSVQKILQQKMIEAFQRQQLELQQQREAENRRQFDVETGQRGRGLDLEQARLDASMRPVAKPPSLVRGIKGPNGPLSRYVDPDDPTKVVSEFEDYEKPPTEKPESAGSDYKQYLARVAKAKGKASADELTVDEELAARKSFGQADDQPKTPFSFIVQTPGGPAMVQSGNPEAKPITMGGQQVAPALTSGQRNDVVKNEAGIDALHNIKNLFKPEYVGPAAGRAYAIAQQLPGDFVPQPPEGFAEFSAAVAANRNQIINLITGAAVGVQEQKRIESEIPLVTDRPEVFQAKLAQTEKNRQRLVDQIARTRGGTQPSTRTLSESDIQAAMTANKWTREKAVSEAQARGYVVR